MRVAPFAVAALFAVAGCARPIPEPAPPAEPVSMPNRRPPPTTSFSSDRALVADRVEEALERYDLDRWERLVDAMDPGELMSDLRIADQEIADGKWRLEWLFLLGDELFEHDFARLEGFGPGRKRIHLGAAGGPDSLSCSECHHRGGFDGAGDLSQNAFFDGDGYAPESGFERNAPHVLGLGVVQKLAEEMTALLVLRREEMEFGAKISKSSMTLPLEAKGVSFGSLTVHPDGTVDTSRVKGVLPDLIVRPFGWKGGQSNIRDFAKDGFQRHHGMQAVDAVTPGPGKGPAYDPDEDQNASEIVPGMLTTITVYLSLLDIPVIIPPEDPGLLDRHGKGWETFHRIGCGNCHRQSLSLADPKLKITETLSVDLFHDGEQPRPRRDVFDDYGTPIYLFSDLQFHAMGAELAESRATVAGVPPDVFLTRPLWGLADTAPYLHDGRASTLDAAILAHGGEAKASRDSFAALSPTEKANVRVFLMSLTRHPRIEYR
jgi:hypothetical protein